MCSKTLSPDEYSESFIAVMKKKNSDRVNHKARMIREKYRPLEKALKCGSIKKRLHTPPPKKREPNGEPGRPGYMFKTEHLKMVYNWAKFGVPLKGMAAEFGCTIGTMERSIDVQAAYRLGKDEGKRKVHRAMYSMAVSEDNFNASKWWLGVNCSKVPITSHEKEIKERIKILDEKINNLMGSESQSETVDLEIDDEGQVKLCADLDDLAQELGEVKDLFSTSNMREKLGLDKKDA